MLKHQAVSWSPDTSSGKSMSGSVTLTDLLLFGITSNRQKLVKITEELLKITIL